MRLAVAAGPVLRSGILQHAHAGGAVAPAGGDGNDQSTDIGDAAFLAAGVALALAVPASGAARAGGGVNWPMFHFNAARPGVTTETTIGSGNVSTLTVTWTSAR
jgi:hypothetical protein